MADQEKEAKKERRNVAGGVLIPAGLFIGMGIGWIFNNLVQGLFIGLGVGFLAFAIIMLTKRNQ